MLIKWLEDHQFSCIVKSTFGIECPGCGTQRAIIALLQGNIMESLQLHPGVFMFIITLGLMFIQLFFKFKNGGWYVLFSFSFTVLITLINYVSHFFR